MKKEPKISEKYLNCNHHHELTEEHELVNFGDGEFVANKKAIPLLKALNDLGLRTRTHHIDDTGHGFFSVLLEDRTHVEVKVVNEVDSTRTKYNGKTEILILW